MNQTLKPASSSIVMDGDRYLLVKRANPPAADMYAFPGGRGEPGETPAQTALRELAEETGLAGTNPRLFARYQLAGHNGGGFDLSVFLVDCAILDTLAANDDASEAGWYTAIQIADLPVPASVMECIVRLEDGDLGFRDGLTDN